MNTRPDVLYLGDSVLDTTAFRDSVKDAIPVMMSRLLPGVGVAPLGNAGWSADVYFAVCQFMAKRGMLPPAVIVPINLRLYSKNWERYPNFERERFFFLHDDPLAWIFFKPLVNFKVIDLPPVSPDPALVPQGAKACFIANYVYPMTQSRNFRSLKKLAALLKREKRRAVFYVTPINIHYCDDQVGPACRAAVERNVQTLSQALASEGFSMLDLAGSLPPGRFETEQSTIEHLDQEGRRYVAGQVAAALGLSPEKPMGARQ
jgi:hypothetical protein